MPTPYIGLVIAALVLTWILICAPGCSFLVRGWEIRKLDILDGLGEETVARYLKTFHRAALATDALTNAERLRNIYTRQFGRRWYGLSLAILLAVSAIALSVTGLSIVGWIQAGSIEHINDTAPAEVVFALLGGCAWVIADLLERHAQNNIRPGDIYNASFRIVLSVPLAYAFAILVRPGASVFLAFIMGLFPTATLTKIARRTFAKTLNITDVEEATNTSAGLQALPSVDRNVAEVLADERVTNLYQLAYSDPVRLTIRTGYTFAAVLTITDQALSELYLGAERAKVARLVGLNSAGECRNLYESLQDKTSQEFKDAESLAKWLSSEFKIPYEGLVRLLSEIAEDPYTDFHWHAWTEAYS
jgi:hypothetical protein